jgi:hypothetical protein
MALPWAGAVLVLVLLGATSAVVGSTALPLVLVVLAVTTAVHAPVAGWRVSFFLTLLAALTLQTSWAWLTPMLGWSLATDNTVAWTVVGLAAVPVAALRGAPPLSRRQMADAAAVLVVPVAVMSYLTWTAATRHYEFLGWAMAGDSANNMIQVRTLIEDGGLLRSQGNPAPLSAAIYAALGAPGMPDDAAGVVKHLVLDGGHLTLLLGCLLSVLTSLLALRATRTTGVGRFALAATAGLLPWLWCVMGYSFRQGFHNAAPAMIVLLLAWSCWQVQRRHPVVAATGMILATWASAATWGPVLVIPALWLVGVLAWRWRSLLRAGRALLLPASALVGAGTYAVLVTLRDLRATGGVPGVDGAVPNYDPWWSLGVGIALLVLSLACFRWLPRETTIGYWLVLPGLALSLYQLIGTRLDAGLPFWGYYPLKLTWIVMATTVLVLFSVVQPALERVARRGWSGNGMLLAFAVCVSTMFWTTPPLRPATLASVVTPVWLHDDTGNDRAYQRMFELMEDQPRTILSGYWRLPEGAGFDGLSNFWLLQSGAEDLGDPLRSWAYFMNPSDPAQLCAAVTEWGGDVRVMTRERKLERLLDKTCPDATYDIRLAPK